MLKSYMFAMWVLNTLELIIIYETLMLSHFWCTPRSVSSSNTLYWFNACKKQEQYHYSECTSMQTRSRYGGVKLFVFKKIELKLRVLYNNKKKEGLTW